MRKWKCESQYFTIVAVMFFMIHVFPAIFGYKVFYKYYGWVDISLYEGIFLTIFYFAIYLFGKYICIEPKVYKCLKCGDVFCETDIVDKHCPICHEELIDIKKYYKKNLKHKDKKSTEDSDEITEMIRKRWNI
jgi:hypothetical protein